ncbi:hypothetical protein SHIRM173S_02370 [Streptomyces hirsutus]
MPALLHRSWTAPGPDAVLAAELEAAATDSTSGTPPALRRTAQVRAAELTPDDALRARRYTAAEQAPSPDIRLRPCGCSTPQVPAGAGAGTRPRRLCGGRVLLADGASTTPGSPFCWSAGLLAGPGPVQDDTAVLGAADAAWAAGDRQGCLRALTHDAHDAHDAHDTHGASVQAAVAGEFDLRAAGANPTGPQEAAEREAPVGPSVHRGATPAQPSVPPPALLRDHPDGMRAVLLGRFDLAAAR